MRNLFAAWAALLLLLSAPRAARAQAGWEDEGGKKVSVFAGLAAGYDTNPRRSESAEADSLLEFRAGLGFQTSGLSRNFALRYKYRENRYTSRPELDSEGHELDLALGAGAGKVKFSLKGDYKISSEPTDIEIVGLLDSHGYSLRPRFNFDLGKTGLVLGYSLRGVRYLDSEYDHLDHTSSALNLGAEFKFAPARAVTVNADFGGVDYVPGARSDYSSSHLAVGMRLESPRRSGLEFALGVNSLTDFAAAPSLARTEVTALVRSTFVLKQERANLELGLKRIAEPAATADYKRVTAAMVRYSHSGGGRLSLIAGARLEFAEFLGELDPGSPPNLSRTILDTGLGCEIGRRSGLHGRLYLLISYENRTGERPKDAYDRLRTVAGIGVVY